MRIKFTRENPFEFEGVKVWRLDGQPGYRPRVVFEDGGRTVYMEDVDARAIAAMLEAESHPATWTDMGDGTWRKGRWTFGPEYAGGLKWVKHDDIPGAKWTPGWSGGDGFWTVARQVHADFLAHLAAQKSEPEFTPPPAPEVGQWIRADLRDRTVVEGEVLAVRPRTDWWAVDISGVGDGLCSVAERFGKDPDDIIAWSPIDPPQPEEPTGLGAVVKVNGDRFTHVGFGAWVHTGEGFTDHASWDGLLARGPVTVESPGVEL